MPALFVSAVKIQAVHPSNRPRVYWSSRQREFSSLCAWAKKMALFYNQDQLALIAGPATQQTGSRHGACRYPDPDHRR